MRDILHIVLTIIFAAIGLAFTIEFPMCGTLNLGAITTELFTAGIIGFILAKLCLLYWYIPVIAIIMVAVVAGIIYNARDPNGPPSNTAPM